MKNSLFIVCWLGSLNGCYGDTSLKSAFDNQICDTAGSYPKSSELVETIIGLYSDLCPKIPKKKRKQKRICLEHQKWFQEFGKTLPLENLERINELIRVAIKELNGEIEKKIIWGKILLFSIISIVFLVLFIHFSNQ